MSITEQHKMACWDEPFLIPSWPLQASPLSVYRQGSDVPSLRMPDCPRQRHSCLSVHAAHLLTLRNPSQAQLELPNITGSVEHSKLGNKNVIAVTSSNELFYTLWSICLAVAFDLPNPVIVENTATIHWYRGAPTARGKGRWMSPIWCLSVKHGYDFPVQVNLHNPPGNAISFHLMIIPYFTISVEVALSQGFQSIL